MEDIKIPVVPRRDSPLTYNGVRPPTSEYMEYFELIRESLLELKTAMESIDERLGVVEGILGIS